MPLLNAKCTNCGAVLEVDDSKDAAICQYCGSAFVVEKAINNYNITNNIVAGTVNIQGLERDFHIIAGTLNKYTGAATDIMIPDTVNIVNADVFSDMAIVSVTIPESVDTLRKGAFRNCSRLKTVTMNGKIEQADDGIFESCKSLSKIKCDGNYAEQISKTCCLCGGRMEYIEKAGKYICLSCGEKLEITDEGMHKVVNIEQIFSADYLFKLAVEYVNDGNPQYARKILSDQDTDEAKKLIEKINNVRYMEEEIREGTIILNEKGVFIKKGNKVDPYPLRDISAANMKNGKLEIMLVSGFRGKFHVEDVTWADAINNATKGRFPIGKHI